MSFALIRKSYDRPFSNDKTDVLVGFLWPIIMAIISVVYVVLYLTTVYSKECKKLDNCRCEMDDGSGIIDLNDIDNKDGSPRFKNIQEPGTIYTYNYNPCTPITTLTDRCKDTNLCQGAGSTGSMYPCGEPYPVFTVDTSTGHVVLKYKELKGTDQYTRSTEITIVCDENNPKGSIDSIKQDVPPGTIMTSVYKGTLRAKSACPVKSGLSVGSILLIIFFPLVLLYVIIGIIVNIKCRNKQSVPEACPNYEFWADYPYLVKDGCMFTFHKIKGCCGWICAKAKGESYDQI